MKSKILYTITILTFLMFAFACSRNKTENANNTNITSDEPIVKDDGKYIEFKSTSEKLKLFSFQTIGEMKTQLSLSAPATVVGRVQKSNGDNNSTIILFDSPDLTGVYSSYLQNQTLLKTSKINFDRVNDLYKNGAVTGKELNDASAELMNIKTQLAENEAKLREYGLSPENLNNSQMGTVWLICDLPESELNLIKKGQKYLLEFPSFANEKMTANIDVVADVMNTQTRKVRIRLSLLDKEEKIRPGMFAKVNFEMPHKGLMIPKKAVISSNGKYFVFVKQTSNTFEKREVNLSTETGDYIEISGGLKSGEEIIISNVYLLKGISLGI